MNQIKCPVDDAEHVYRPARPAGYETVEKEVSSKRTSLPDNRSGAPYGAPS